jgi:hypothetical protein
MMTIVGSAGIIVLVLYTTAMTYLFRKPLLKAGRSAVYRFARRREPRMIETYETIDVHTVVDRTWDESIWSQPDRSKKNEHEMDAMLREMGLTQPAECAYTYEINSLAGESQTVMCQLGWWAHEPHLGLGHEFVLHPAIGTQGSGSVSRNYPYMWWEEKEE